MGEIFGPQRDIGFERKFYLLTTKMIASSFVDDLAIL